MENNFCEFCWREFGSKSALNLHRETCKKNPNYKSEKPSKEEQEEQTMNIIEKFSIRDQLKIVFEINPGLEKLNNDQLHKFLSDQSPTYNENIDKIYDTYKLVSTEIKKNDFKTYNREYWLFDKITNTFESDKSLFCVKFIDDKSWYVKIVEDEIETFFKRFDSIEEATAFLRHKFLIKLVDENNLEV